MIRSGNPALNARVFQQVGSPGLGGTMTLQGTVNKTIMMLVLLVMTASYVWGRVFQPAAPTFGEEAPGGAMAGVGTLMMVGVFGGFMVALITIFKKQWAPVTAPVYALLEGLAIGGVSAIFEQQFPGIALQAVGLTFGTLFCLLMAYKSGFVRVTEKFKLGVTAATGAICLIYLVNLVMGFFGASIGMIHSSGMVGIGFSLVVVGVAALNLVMDFDFIEKGSEMGLPKYMEWYGAFGLMVTLIWLYMEMLRLLAKLNSRR
jgi:uncharacterized YccA/Bax inhibitor family protein